MEVETHGMKYWLAWDDEGHYDLAPDKEQAIERLVEPVDFRHVCLHMLALNFPPKDKVSNGLH